MENLQITPSSRLFHPRHKVLRPYHGEESLDLETHARVAETDIAALLSQKDYPCLAAIRSYHHDEYRVGFYESFGEGRSWRELRNDLLLFLQEQKNTSSTDLTFWAIYESNPGTSEEDFENRLWQELSFLTSKETQHVDWPADAPTDPEDKKFCFSLGGEAFFVVGLHPHASRKSRRFPRPALIFNVFRQFRALMDENRYAPLVEQNRKRDLRFEGSVNPMAQQHGDGWESIQFSGRNNGPEWKCPFHFLHDKNKP